MGKEQQNDSTMNLQEVLLALQTIAVDGEDAEAARNNLYSLREITRKNKDAPEPAEYFRLDSSLLTLLPTYCPNLAIIDLHKTDLHNLSFLRGLPNVHTLDLRETYVADITPLQYLPRMVALLLDETQVSNIKPLASLSNLRVLSINESLITDISPLAALSELLVLHIDETRVNDISPIKELTQLKSLSFNGTNVTDVSSLGGLINLKDLSLSKTNVSDISSFAHLLHLEELRLFDTKVNNLAPLEKLLKLTYLFIAGTPVSDVAPLASLAQLSVLSMNRTRVTDLSPLEGLSNLKILQCSELHLDRVPRFCLLDNIYFEKNNITVAQQPSALFNLPTQEILATYYDVDRVPVNEGKVIFLGESGVGKTHTIERIQSGGKQIDYQEDTTAGVIIRPYERSCGPNIKFWDFGGQEIIQSTHHCFLTERSCYVIVVSYKDPDKAMGNAEKWLRTIAGYSRGVSVLLAVNQWHGSYSAEKNIDEIKLRRICPTLSAVVYYSAVDDNEEDFTHNLTDRILHEVEKLDSVKLELPPAWAAIRNEMVHMQEDYISLDDYYRICAAHGLGGEDETNASIRAWLLEWFNDLGICFNYHQNHKNGGTTLTDYKVLNPKWLTCGIYRVLWNGSTYSGGGILHREDFDKLLTDSNLRPVDSNFDYRGSEKSYILEIMQKFQRAYVLDPDKIFVPELLEGRPPAVTESLGERQIMCLWKMTYLPIHLLHRVMIALYDHCDGVIWRYGIRLRIGEESLLIEAQPDERLLILTLNRMDGNNGDPSKLFCEVRRLLLEALGEMRLILEGEKIYVDWNGAIGEYGLNSLVEKYWKAPNRILNNTDGKDWEFTVGDLLEPLFGRNNLWAAIKLSRFIGCSPIQALDDVISVLPYATNETLQTIHDLRPDMLQELKKSVSISDSSVKKLTKLDIGKQDIIVLLGILKRAVSGFSTWIQENATKEYSWERTKTKLMTLLEPGINRDLLLWASDSPLYQMAIGNADQNYEKLANALGPKDWDRGRASIDLMKIIWWNHPELGLSPDYEHLVNLEFDRGFYPKYRDHTTHMFKVFLLGLYLYEKRARIRDAVNNSGLDDKEFLGVWILASLFHDAGYVIETEKTTSEVYQRMTETLSQPLTNLYPKGTFGNGTEKGIIERDDIQMPHIEHMSRIKKMLDRFDGKGRSVRLAVHGGNPILTYFNETSKIVEARTSEEQNRSYFDHGIVSAGMMLFFQEVLSNYYDRFPESELFAEQREKLLALRAFAPVYKEYVDRAAFAVALHNISKDFSGNRIANLNYEGVTLGEFCIPLEIGLEPGTNSEPIAYLLRLCDELQCWDRQSFAGPFNGRAPLDGNKLNFVGEDESLALKVSDPSAKDSITAALDGILMPSLMEILPLV